MSKSIFNLVGRISMEGLGGVAKGLDGAEKNAVKFSKQIGKVGRQVGSAGMAITKSLSVPLTALGGVIAGLSYTTGQYADKLLDLSEATDLSTDTIQELKHVSTDAKVSFDGVASSIQMFSRRLSQAGEESGRISGVLEKLGISVKDDVTGEFRSMNDLFPEIMKSLQGMENRTQRNTMAQQIFGSELKNLAPIMGMTNEHFEELRKNAHETGLVMDGEALEASKNFTIAVDKLKERLSAMGREISMRFLPLLQDTVLPMIEDQLIPAFVSFADKIKGVADWFTSLPKGVQETTIKIGAFIAILGPAMLVISKVLLAVKGLTAALIATKAAVIGLTMAFATNPFGLAIIAVGALVAGFIGLKKSIYDADKQYNDSVWGKLTEGTAKHSEEMEKYTGWWIKLRGEIGEAWKQTKDLDWITKEYGESLKAPISRAIALGAEAEKFKGTLLEQIEALDEFYDMTKKVAATSEEVQTKSRELTDEEIEALKKLQEQRDRMNQEYLSNIQKLTLSRLELLEIEEIEAVAKAKKIGADVLQIEDYFALQRGVIESERLREQREKEELFLKEKEDLEKHWNDAVFYQNAQDRLTIVEREYKQALEHARENKINTTDLEAYYSKIRRDIIEQEAQAKQAALISAVQNWASEAGNVLGNIGNLFRQFNRNRMIEVDNWLAGQLEANEMSTLSEEEKQEKKTELEAEADEKRRELQRKAAKSEKAFGIFNSIINTAQGVASALKAGFPVGLIMAGVYGALGAAQTAMIAAQPLPQLNVGGVLRNDQVIQAHANEAILPLNRQVLGDLGAKIAQATASKGAVNNNRETHLHLHIGNYIGDEKSKKDLVRAIRPILIREDQRTGTT